MAYTKKNVANKKNALARRHARVRAHLSGTEARPRLSVYKSNKFIYAQIINDEKGVTLVSYDSRKEKKGTMLEKASKVGESVAALAKAKKIGAVVFDRGGFLYTGLIKSLADGARKGGLKF